MYIVIVGCGRLGSKLASDLSNDGHDVSIVDNNEENLERLGSGFNGHRVKGVEIDHDILLEAGITSADVFLVMTQDDNINIMASQIAKNIFGVKRVMARVNDPSRDKIYKKLGIEAVSTTQLGANIIKSRIGDKRCSTIIDLDENISIIEVPILKGKVSKSRDIEEKYNCIISSVLRDRDIKIPKKDELIKVGDVIICSAGKKDRERLVQAFMGEMIE
jgi:trk system potassium uptake protein